MKPMLHGTDFCGGGYQVMDLLWGLRFVYQNAFIFLGYRDVEKNVQKHLKSNN